MNIAVIGRGINGIMAAWELLKQGHAVTFFEKGEAMQQTSLSSSNLLHGGLRYLENFEFRLVPEALKERQWWIEQVLHLAHPLKLYIPIYKNGRRPAWLYKIGLWLYDLLAGRQTLGRHQSLTKQKLQETCPGLRDEGLIKGFTYFDGQMDDYQLGHWVLQQSQKQPGLVVLEQATVEKVTEQGMLTFTQDNHRQTRVFAKIINIAGPWAETLLRQSDIEPKYTLDLVRGRLLLINRKIKQGYFFEVPNERRIFFVLPCQAYTLIGTTEQRQTLDEEIEPSEQEIDYLITAYNHYFKTPINKHYVFQSFAGLRPLIKCAKDSNKAIYEYTIQQNQNVITVFGSKLTTARQLAIKIAK